MRAVPPTTSRHKPDWRTTAPCAADPDAMFPDSDQAGIAYAKSICSRCPVMQACGQWALDERIQFGVWGGLSEKERAGLLRQAARRNPEAVAAGQARQPSKPYTTMRDLFDDNTARLIHGHLAWTGPTKPSFKGRTYNPKRVAFIADRGRQPVGRVLTTCSLDECVLPAHIADDEERMPCGTRPGYQRHLRDGEAPCDACRQANTDADNRLRRTGSTKAAA